MNQAIDITTSQRKTILALLEKHLPNTTTWVYGSRAKWTSRPQSDLDMVVFTTPEQHRKISDLREAFEESNLPFRVDLFVWDEVPEQFRKEIEVEHVVLVEKKELGMVDEWVHCTLADACSAINYGLTASASDHSFGPKFLRITDIVSGQLDWNRVPHVEVESGTIEKYRLYDGDIVIARTGASTGVSTYVRNPPPAVFASYLVRLKANPDFSPRFLSYYLKSKKFWDYIRGVLGDKSAQPNASASTMAAAPLSAPKNKKEQRAIAHILGTLDDKIELNLQMNQTLEAMARALFKSWFVDFDPVRAKIALKHLKSITPPLRGGRQGKGASPQASRWGEIKRLYSPQTLKRTKALRQSQSNAEGLLWHYLRKKQLDGHKFRRQQPIGRYIVDFVCMVKKLVIELDGGQHSTQKAYDEQRDQFLTERGYRVLRFWNSLVFENCYGVLESILTALRQESPPSPSPNHSPLEGESARQGSQPAGEPVGGRQSKGASPKLSRSPVPTPPPGGSDWTVERAKAYLEKMPSDVADLFPDQLVDSELGEIPKGWKVNPLEKVAEQHRNGVSPEQFSPDTPYIALDHMPKRCIALGEWGSAKGLASGKFKFERGNILFGKLRPYFHKVGVAPLDGICSTDIVVISPKRRRWNGFVLGHVSSSAFVNYTDATSTGTKMPRTKWADMAQYKATLPDQKVVKAFEDIIQPTISRISSAIHESRALAALRDALLPSLVSGELRVKNSKFIKKEVL